MIRAPIREPRADVARLLILIWAKVWLRRTVFHANGRMKMTDISAWLLAIYAEQEKVARQCACGAKSGSLDCLGRAHLSHFAVADIATRKETLADLAAKKAIVEAYQEAATLWEATGSERSLPAASIDGAFVALEHAVRLLAFAHADKPGYQAEWGVG